MGVDLSLLPMMSKDQEWPLSDQEWPLSYQIIEINRRRELWDKIASLPQKHIEKLGCYLAKNQAGETCYGDVTETPYGDKITCTTAGQLLTLRNHLAVLDNWQNRAVWAYLAEMPSDWPIALYWH